MVVPGPFVLPPDFLARFGYRWGRRFVALYWTSLGDEVCFADGRTSGCGLLDNHHYLAFARRPDVSAWLDEHGIRLGDSEREAEHWLVVDGLTNEVHAAPWRVADLWVFRQALPG